MSSSCAHARYVAANWACRNYRPHHMNEVQTNVGLGTKYLKLVLDQVGHPILASTPTTPARGARGAGATRGRSRRGLRRTIPFSETRDYLKNVMANSVFTRRCWTTSCRDQGRLGPFRAARDRPAVEDELPKAR